ncbi:phosphatase PAP2 family protein [Tepidibacillus sp. LV47]|uniref:phosphatase PAP2 family protein n=1 Tax=Tepidibacillus sp. LV47 TaxID=3398228 RepID=UPI003AAF582B
MFKQMYQKFFHVVHTSVLRIGKHFVWGLAIGILLLFVFAKLVEDLLFNELGMFDTIVTQYIQSFASPNVTKLMVFITQLGSGPILTLFLLIVGGIFYFRYKKRRDVILLAGGLIGGALLNVALKDLFRRSRPDITHLVEAGGYSFPSGHSMVSTTFYGILSYLLWIHLKERKKSTWYVPILTIILILSIGISRIYLGVHFPSDVIAGFSAGGILVIAGIIGYESIKNAEKI